MRPRSPSAAIAARAKTPSQFPVLKLGAREQERCERRRRSATTHM